MSILANEIKRGIGEMKRILDTPTFTWRETEIECIPATAGNELGLAGGVVDASVDLVLIVQITDLPTPIEGEDLTRAPWSGELVTYDDVEYRLLRIRKPPGVAHYEFDLVSPTQ